MLKIFKLYLSILTAFGWCIMPYVLFWAVFYGAVHIFFSRFPFILPAAMLAYVAVLLLWLYRKGKWRSFGLCKISPLSAAAIASLIPAFLPSVVNIFLQKGINADFGSCLLMLSVATAEEIFFRGVLLYKTEKFHPVAAIMINGGIFALFHVVNVINQVNLVYVFMQIMFAFAMGVLFAAIRLNFKSIFPCITAHFCSNVTAFGVTEIGSAWIWASAVLCLCWGLIICRKNGMFQKEQ